MGIAVMSSSGLAALLWLTLTTASAQSAPPGKLGGAEWQARVQQEIRSDEYRFHLTAPGLWGAPNRAQGLRSRVSVDGLEVVGRTEASWRLVLRTASFGRLGTELPSFAREVRASGEHLEIEHGELREWFVNDERGLEQGWTIAGAPAGPEPLWIGLEVGGLSFRIDEGGRSGVFFDEAGHARLFYTGLLALDAEGRALPASLRSSAQGLGIVIEDRGARYPLTVDPWLTGPLWTAEGEQAGAQLGAAVASAGDVNGDGYRDVLVGAPLYDGGETDEGRALVYLGSASGLGTSAAWTVESNQADARLGASVAGAGDVNGDGYADVLVGVPQHDGGETDEGRTLVYLGSASGLGTSAAWSVESDQAGAQLGASVAGAGDVDGDGFSDVLVGAPQHDGGEADEGRALVYLGSASGPGASADWSVESDQAGAHLGASVASAGDVNGDGRDDVLLGAPEHDGGDSDEGRASVYLGSASGLAASAAWAVEGNQAGAAFGRSVAAVGDADHDGYADVIVGAPGFDGDLSGEGRATLYRGSVAGLAIAAAWSKEGDQLGCGFGACVAAAGDVNGDGRSDALVGADLYDAGESDEGRAQLFLGTASGLETNAHWSADGEQSDARFGGALASAGDVNGDGYSDVVVGASGFDGGDTDEGRAALFLGSSAPPATVASWIGEGNQDFAYFGVSVASGGDVNGDGYGDVVVGAQGYNQTEGRAFLYLGSASGLATSFAWSAGSGMGSTYYGSSVCSAGDVNGDGYDDVGVGASFYATSNVGRAYVYLGSPSGLSFEPVWVTSGTQNNELYGTRVASAGDVDGDGFGDLLVFSRGFVEDFANEGKVFLYLGSASGLGTTAAWSRVGGASTALFGWSLGSAGDVNGDGYGDVIVGARAFSSPETSEGRAYVFLGSAGGLALDPDWTAESNQAHALFGTSVATAGDVNRDGYSDVLVGAPSYTGGQTDEGRAYLYLGSASGLAASPAWTAEIDQAEAGFGECVAGAGDVNGDGHDDAIVGADLYDNGSPAEGGAFLYLGSATGLAATPAWSIDGTRAAARMGFSVAGAGDVNGDGYADTLVGAFGLGNATDEDEGRAFVHLGGDARGGRIRAPRQVRPFGDGPIAVLGRTVGSEFRIQVEHPALVGGGEAFLEWEVEPLGGAFDGVGVERSALGQPVLPSNPLLFEELATPGGALDLPYLWRARVVVEGNPFFPSTPWFGVAGNADLETDLRFKGAGKPVRPGPPGPFPTRTGSVP
jgi:FG-GAP repeat protein